MSGLVDVAVPKDSQALGADFSLLLKKESPKWNNHFFGQYDLHNSGLAYMRMYRTTEWKLVRHYRCDMMDELYDLKNDPGETKNLYQQAKSPAPREALQKELDAWMKSINDPLLKD
jgi:uncharacterized sulfatase